MFFFLIFREFRQLTTISKLWFIPQSSTPQTCKPVLFIGNKCDLDHDRVVSKEHGKSVADELGGGRIGHHETSAKSNINVTEVYCGGKKEKLLICFQIKSNNTPLSQNTYYLYSSFSSLFQIFQDIIRVIKVEDANKGKKGKKNSKGGGKSRCTIIQYQRSHTNLSI